MSLEQAQSTKPEEASTNHALEVGNEGVLLKYDKERVSSSNKSDEQLLDFCFEEVEAMNSKQRLLLYQKQLAV